MDKVDGIGRWPGSLRHRQRCAALRTIGPGLGVGRNSTLDSKSIHRLGSPRRGVILIAVLVCMAVVSSITLSAVAAAIQFRRQLATEHQMEQTRWLAEAGLRRAIAGDAVDDEAVWDATAALANYRFARVTTKVVESPANTVEVTAVIAALGDSGRETKHSIRGRIMPDTTPPPSNQPDDPTENPGDES